MMNIWIYGVICTILIAVIGAFPGLNHAQPVKLYAL
jgi:hypothetical protein